MLLRSHPPQCDEDSVSCRAKTKGEKDLKGAPCCLAFGTFVMENRNIICVESRAGRVTSCRLKKTNRQLDLIKLVSLASQVQFELLDVSLFCVLHHRCFCLIRHIQNLQQQVPKKRDFFGRTFWGVVILRLVKTRLLPVPGDK